MTPVTLTVVVTLDGADAQRAAENLRLLVEDGRIDQVLLNALRAEMQSYEPLSDWRIVRAPVQAGKVEP